MRRAVIAIALAAVAGGCAGDEEQFVTVPDATVLGRLRLSR
jgi:hypothetical protein